jgi:hypothetical protein
MNKEKQIEEMADEVYETLMLEAECPLSGMDCAIIADLLVNKKGYRKATEVAREIFEEIGELVNEYLDGRIYTHDFCTYLAELKKKYTESEKDNG